jgi:hypothetical protein
VNIYSKEERKRREEAILDIINKGGITLWRMMVDLRRQIIKSTKVGLPLVKVQRSKSSENVGPIGDGGEIRKR